MADDRGAQAYPHKHRQHRKARSHHKKNTGNVTSIAASRPITSYRRALVKAECLDSAHHQAIDQRAPGAPRLVPVDCPSAAGLTIAAGTGVEPSALSSRLLAVEHARGIARKTRAQTWVSMRPPTANQNQTQRRHSGGQSAARRRRHRALPKCVHLPLISPGLYVANRAYVDAGLPGEHAAAIQLVVNLTSASSSFRPMDVAGRRVVDLPLADSRDVSFAAFNDRAQRCAELIRHSEATGAGILLFCNAGTNRSCAVALAYAVAAQRMPLADAIHYVEAEKGRALAQLSASPVSWDTLTNERFRHFLQVPPV